MATKQIKIAVMGQMRVGKDTVAELLKQKAEFEEHKFSDGITAIIQRHFPDVLAKGKPRQHYQLIGQSFRQLDSDVWIKQLDKKLNTWKNFNFRVYDSLYFSTATHGKLNFIITDVRQENEVEYCRNNGFILIKVVADEAVRLQRIEAEGDCFSEEQLQDETELSVNSYYSDFLIDNSGSYEQLEQKVNSIWQEITGGKQYEQ